MWQTPVRTHHNQGNRHIQCFQNFLVSFVVVMGLCVCVCVWVCMYVCMCVHEEDEVFYLDFLSPRHFEVLLNSHSLYKNLIEIFALQISKSTIA